MEVTNIDTGNLVKRDALYQDDTLTFAGAATVAAGTILARDSSTLKLVPYVKGGSTNENGIPKAVIAYAVTAAGAGDKRVRVAISGVFVKDKLIINADDDASNIDAAVLDQLRSYGIVAESEVELNTLDNQ